MKKMSLFAPLAIALVAVLFLAVGGRVPAIGADGAVNRAEVEKIVEEYINNNPEKILMAVDAYQRKSMGDQQSAALEKNKSRVFDNPDTPVVGNPSGDITIVEFFDYNCGYCKRAFTEIEGLLAADKGVKVLMKEFPILAPSSETAAKWALAANKQGKYLAFHKGLMDHRGPLEDASIEKIAKDVGLDVAKARSDAESDAIAKVLASNREIGQSIGISGTPAFAIGDQIYPGMLSKDQLIEAVAEARGKKAK